MDVLPLHPDRSEISSDSSPNTSLNSRDAALESSSNVASPSRMNFAGLDAVRAGAGLSVVLLHSCVPYLRHPMPGLCWPVRDTPNTVVDWLFWTIELFIMPLFLLLAGFFAWQTLQRHGASKLVRNRARRLLVPLLFGIVFVLPFDLYAWVAGWVAEGLVPAVKLKSLKFEGGVDKDLWGLSHLWFLQYLFLYVVAVSGFVWLQSRWKWLSRIQLSLTAAIGWTIAIGSIILFFRPEVVWGFQHSFLPVLSKWLYSGLFFVLGIVLAIHDGQLRWLTDRCRRMVIPAGFALVTALAMGGWQLRLWQHSADGFAQASNPLASTPLASALLAVATTSGALLISLAVIGLANRSIKSVPVAVRYLAAASFWVYIVHHPVVGLVHIDLKWLVPGLPTVLKVSIAFATTSLFCLLTYEGLVRKTWLGRLLGFSWEIPSSENADNRTLLRLNQHRPTGTENGDRGTTHDEDKSADGPQRRAA